MPRGKSRGMSRDLRRGTLATSCRGPLAPPYMYHIWSGRRVRLLNPRKPAIVASFQTTYMKGAHDGRMLLQSRRRDVMPQVPSIPCAADTPVCTRENGDGNFEPMPRGCCMCPVLRDGGGGDSGAGGPSYALNLTHGRTYYRPSGSYGYGGNGVLLSRGLLDAIPEHAWQLCARRLVCGSSDFRLASCVHNLAPRSVAHHEIRENDAFFRAALDRPDEKALGINAYYNTFFSTIHKDPKRGPRVLEHFARAHRPRCPWSMHKLQPRCVPYVYNASRHCLALPPGAGMFRNDSVLAFLKPLVVSWGPNPGSCF